MVHDFSFYVEELVAIALRATRLAAKHLGSPLLVLLERLLVLEVILVELVRVSGPIVVVRLKIDSPLALRAIQHRHGEPIDFDSPEHDDLRSLFYSGTKAMKVRFKCWVPAQPPFVFFVSLRIYSQHCGLTDLGDVRLLHGAEPTGGW